ncbi:MAG: transcriptional repressor [Phycisphaerae bacterium]|jgi:Fur family ferric uptake transcriptional regulator
MIRERRTVQRQTIKRVLEEAGRPMSPQEVHVAARKSIPGIGLATVYRAVRRLLDQGWLVTVDIPGEPPRYELAGKTHHHHFFCRGCGRTFDVKGCPQEIKSLTPRGFRLEGHELVLYGRCPRCLKRE